MRDPWYLRDTASRSYRRARRTSNRMVVSLVIMLPAAALALSLVATVLVVLLPTAAFLALPPSAAVPVRPTLRGMLSSGMFLVPRRRRSTWASAEGLASN